MQNDAMQFIYDRIGPVCPRVQRTIEGSSLFTIDCTLEICTARRVC